MNLYDEKAVEQKKEKARKTKKMVILGIIVSVVLIVALMCLIFYLIYNPDKITVKVDNKKNEKLANMLEKEYSRVDDSIIIYAPIRDLATLWNYESFKGEYETNFDDENSCYIKSEQEVVIFKLNSNIIYKIDLTQSIDYSSGYDYEEIEIADPIIKKEDKLYLSLDGIRKAFNVVINDYNDKDKKINIVSLKALCDDAKILANSLGYVDIDQTLVNARALFNNRIVVIKSDGKKGIIGFSGNIQGKEIIGAQYDDIKYIPQKNLFEVKKLNKIGIRDENGNSKIREEYDNLTLIDSENNLYLAKSGSLYGVIDIDGRKILDIQYEQIGVDTTKYLQNGVKNGYILLKKLIPVKKSDVWGFFTIEKDESGKINAKLTNNIAFSKIGCETNRASAGNILVMEDYDVVVVKKNDDYGLMYSNGKYALSPVLTDLYFEIINGQKQYFMVFKRKHI